MEKLELERGDGEAENWRIGDAQLPDKLAL
jgi:hypothetical protein